jgi:hypothetical protein
MFTLPFLRKETTESESYIFMLFLSGNRLYGFAFEETNPENQSVLYQEPVDPHLKNAPEKIEKIIGNCEQDLGENVYLKRTVLVLNSLYTTESGSIKEDFLKEIKKLLDKVDLKNLGYLNFHEVVLHNFSQKKNYLLVEETIYDYMLYSVEEGLIKKSQKITKTQLPFENIKNLQKSLPENTETVAWFDHKTDPTELKINHLLTEAELRPYLIKIYFKDKKDEVKVNNSEALPLAPGFSFEQKSLETANISKQTFSKPKLEFLNFAWLPKLPNFSKKAVWIALPVGFLALGFAYLLFLHKATILLKTKKENFSSEIKFIVQPGSDFVKHFQTKVDLSVSQRTTGEKVTGEKARGEVTIYNGLFEKIDLDSGTELQSNNGMNFVVDEKVSVPAATTSANLDEGLVTTAYGKKNVAVTAAEIGAEGNLDSGAKLSITGHDANDFYALANADFKGGVKKTVAIFSNDDAISLSKKALVSSKNKLKTEFHNQYSQTHILFPDTVSASGVKKNYSAEINNEVDKVTLSYKGEVKAYYSPYSKLAAMVQQQKLEDKEFVQGSFELAKIKLLKESENRYSYSAIAKGQVQNFIDKGSLLNSIKGKPTKSAQEELSTRANIVSFEVKTGPLPLPILPFTDKAINFEFER